ncbi:MAG: LytR/AlgR family response regulator transcription factor [Chitinophagaceae bacterium]
MYTCIIIDDDLLAATELKWLLNDINNITLIKLFTNSVEAVEYLKSNTIDIVFLDIEMPKLNGIEFAKTIDNQCSIIFTTSHTNFALQGFNLGVVDYLVKPLIKERLKIAIEKAIQYANAKTLSLKTENSNNQLITIAANRKTYTLHTDEIIYIESQREYMMYVTTKSKLLTLATIKETEDALPTNQFIRIHKSFIVNKNFITAYTTQKIILNQTIELNVGRLYKNNFIDFMKTNNTNVH